MDDLDKLIQREGGLSNHPNDKGGLTKYGITRSTLSWYLGRPATDADLRNLTVDTAKAIYVKRYVHLPGFDKLPESVLRSQLVDFGVTSGPQLAITHLQEILAVPADGILGPQTLGALQQADLTQVNKQLATRRCLMAARICKRDPSQLAFLVGWLQRFLSFI